MGLLKKARREITARRAKKEEPVPVLWPRPKLPQFLVLRKRPKGGPSARPRRKCMVSVKKKHRPGGPCGLSTRRTYGSRKQRPAWLDDAKKKHAKQHRKRAKKAKQDRIDARIAAAARAAQLEEVRLANASLFANS